MDYSIQLSDQDLALVGEGLSTLPYGKVFQLIAKLEQQMLEQQALQPSTEGNSNE